MPLVETELDRHLASYLADCQALSLILESLPRRLVPEVGKVNIAIEELLWGNVANTNPTLTQYKCNIVGSRSSPTGGGPFSLDDCWELR